MRNFHGMSDALVTTERRAGTLICHLDDGKANALSNDMITAIGGVIAEAEGDDTIHAVVLHGRPGKFSAGFDLTVMLAEDMSAMADLVAIGHYRSWLNSLVFLFLSRSRPGYANTRRPCH